MKNLISIKNPFTFKTLKTFKNYLSSLNHQDKKVLSSFINYLSFETIRIYSYYSSKVQNEIISPLYKTLSFNPSSCSSKEFSSIVDLTAELGLKMGDELDSLKKIQAPINNQIDLDGEISEKELTKLILKNFNRLVSLDSPSNGLFNSCDELYRRLINVPLMYYKNLFNLTKIDNQKLNKLLPRAIEVPLCIVGEKDKDGNIIYSTTYERYFYLFLEILKFLKSEFEKANYIYGE